jgi:serine/threonine-protein kinase
MFLPTATELPFQFGPYRLLSVLGQGGMARVYRAEKTGDMGFSTDVALKVVMRPHPREDSEFVKLLTREALIGGLMSHPNIVKTHDFSQVDGHYYIAMECVSGSALERLLRLVAKDSELVPPVLALDVVQQTCRGLSYAHSLCDRSGRPLNIIHRDIKPGNILLSRHGVVKITDFGIAKAAVETGVVTATNVVRGTPLYMSPEQATGSAMDHRSDLFTVGLILYELLTGQRLFEMKDIVSTMESIARAKIGDAPDEVEALVPGLGEVLRHLLTRRPRERYSDAEEVELVLADLAEGLSPPGEFLGEASLRDSLRALAVAASESLQGSAQMPVVTEPDTGARIPIDLETLNRMNVAELREIAESALSEVTASSMKIAALPVPPSFPESDPEDGVDEELPTEPYLDPVIRRTSVVLSQVLDALDEQELG